MNAQTLELMPVEEKASLPDLAKLDLEAIALAQFGDWKGDVEKATKKLTGLVLDLSTQSKIDEAKSLRHRTINQPIADVRKVSKALKSKLASVSKAVGAEEESAVLAWDGVATLITPQIEAREAVLAEEKAERERVAAELKAHHQAEADKIRNYVTQAKGLPSERIAKGLEVVTGLVFDGAFIELYEAAKAYALDGLNRLHAEALASEAAEAKRLENERIAADLAAQKKALDEQAAELKRLQAEALAARVALTHAIVFTFPEPEPVAVPAIMTPAAEPVDLMMDAVHAFVAIDQAVKAEAITPEVGARFASLVSSIVADDVIAEAQKPSKRITLSQLCERLAPVSISAVA